MNILYCAPEPPSEYDIDFDPTFGHDKDALLSMQAPEEVEGFADFWRDTYKQFQAQDIIFEKREVEQTIDGWEIFQVYFKALDGIQSGAWVGVPQGVEITSGMVIGHGYGGREGCDTGGVKDGCAVICPVSRGFHISDHESIPLNDSSKHVIHGIETKETYVIRGCVAEHWYAASILQELFPQIGDNLYYFGGSYGGGIGALMLPWDSRFKKGYLSVPTFGHHPSRLKSKCTGSGEAVRQYYLKHPEVTEVLKFYDAAVAATYIKIPMIVSPALFDPAVPPPGQFAVCNSLAGEKNYFIHTAGHFEHKSQVQEGSALWDFQREFFAN